MSTSESEPLLPKRSISPTREPPHHSNDSQTSQSGDCEDGDTQDSDPLQPDGFYELIGMKSHPRGESPSNLEAAHGFYGQMCRDKRRVERKYRVYDIIIWVLLVSQIVLSAIFILLGALNVDQHIAIATLGGVSSVIAGVLALIRGQGLPNRLRMERDGLKKVILEADELYWDFRAGREVTYEDVKKIRDAYESVLEDAWRNHPDTWNSTTLANTQGLTADRHIRKT